MSMIWSKMKKKMENEFLHEQVKNKLEFHFDRYRQSHDQHSAVVRVVYKGETVFKGNNLKEYLTYVNYSNKIRKETNCEVSEADNLAIAQMYNEGIVSQMEFTDAMFDYFNLSIEEALHHENPLIRSFALLDKRVGQRRLEKMDETSFVFPLEKICYDIRTNQK